MSGPLSLILAAGVSFVTGVGLVAGIREVARVRGLVAQPRGDRWHRRPTALLGGVAIWGAMLAGMAVAGVGLDRVWAIVGGGSVLCALGAVDDVLDVKPSTKLLAQFVAASVVVGVGFRMGFFENPILNVAASFLWIVTITNAVNLLDNMDGLAAGIVLIALAYLGWNYASEGSVASAALAVSICGALAAFILFNFNPASIFMGDSGSMLIGFSLATLSLVEPNASNVLSFVAVPAVILLVPILDTTLVSVTRLLRGRPVTEGGRDHASHRLVKLGLSEREAVGLLWTLAVVAGACAIVTEQFSYGLGLALLPVIVVGFALVGVYLSRMSFVEAGAENGESGAKPFVRLALELSFKRRILEILLDFVLVLGCYYLAYAFRFEFDVPDQFMARFRESLPIVVATTFLAFFYQGIYRGVWTYVSTEDLVKYAQACALAVLFALAAVIIAYRFEGYPRSVFPLYGILVFLALGGSRVSFRMMDEALERRRPGRPVLVVGAGSCGEIAVREILRNRDLGLKVVGFADDDPLKVGRRIHRYPVLGATEELHRIHEQAPFSEVILATRKLPVSKVESVRRFCRDASLSLRSFHVVMTEPEESLEPAEERIRAQ